jgi:hypothetical protein
MNPLATNQRPAESNKTENVGIHDSSIALSGQLLWTFLDLVKPPYNHILHHQLRDENEVFIYFPPEKNQEPLLPPLPPLTSFCNALMVGVGATRSSRTGGPPPLNGFAILLPAPLKEKPPVGEPRPLVEPDLAASRRSFTAVSWASNLIRFF